ncbi:MAG: hypothetical protein OES13_10345 [Acidimicrobiia bacterium]|nr:hypothetical protein [Acidimicrobiia bacterium]
MMGLIGGACGDSTTRARTTTTGPTATGAPTTPLEVVITATDYEYLGVPDVVAVGTTIKLMNASSEEFHSAFIIRLDDGDERTAEELTALSVGELAPASGADPNVTGTMQVAMFARPGESEYRTVLGGPRISTPGRYVILCLVPVGADPAEVESQVEFGAPRQIEGVDRHDQVGEFAEFIVEG